MKRFAFAPLLILATPLTAQSVQDLVFATDPPCYSRSYDAAHLDAHPDQQVTLMVVRADTEDMALDQSDDLLALVDVMTRSSKTPYSGIATCIPGNLGLYCLMEGDAGGFFLSQDGKKLRLDVLENGMSFEGATDFITLEHDTGDDRVFLLEAGICG